MHWRSLSDDLYKPSNILKQGIFNEREIDYNSFYNSENMFPSIDENEETNFIKEQTPLTISLENNIEITKNKMIDHQEIENIISFTPIKIREKGIIHRKQNSKSEETKPYERLERVEEKTKSSTSAKKRDLEIKGIRPLINKKDDDDNISSKSNDTIEEKNEEECQLGGNLEL